MKIFIITGQTATGKTNYALELAQTYNGELINCDSRQIYKDLDIITGKDIEPQSLFYEITKIDRFSIGYYNLTLPQNISITNTYQLQTTNSLRTSIPIWLYDVVSPHEYFSSFDYQLCAIHVMKDIIERGKTPIIVGGTYFYLKHLLYTIETENIQPNWELRNELETKTVEELQQLLCKKNAELFAALNESDKHNPRRLIRKIEIVSNSKTTPVNQSKQVSLHEKLRQELGVPQIEIEFSGLASSREKLERAINKRVEKRLAQGAIEEVKQLLAQGYTKDDPGMQTIGYKQLIDYLEGASSLEEAKQVWINKELQYAKRQLTFMKKDKNIQWSK